MLVFQIEDLDVHAIAKEVLTSFKRGADLEHNRQILHALVYSIT